MGLAIPAIEITDHAHAFGIGRPDGEVDARHAIAGVELRSELFVALPVAALAEQMQVVIGEHG